MVMTCDEAKEPDMNGLQKLRGCKDDMQLDKLAKEFEQFLDEDGNLK